MPFVNGILSQGISFVTLDLSGSGLSDGWYVTLGWKEQDDLEVLVKYLRNINITDISLWGRSMGAVTCIQYASRDPHICSIVADSPFLNLRKLAIEFA